MRRYKEIKIDLEVHRAIEQQRLSFAESENDILRRLLFDTAKTRPNRNLRSRPAETRKRGQWAAKVLGDYLPAENMKDAYRRVLLALHKRDSEFLSRFANKRSRGRRYLAKKPEDLYLNSPHLAASHAKPLVDGWYFDTNLSREQTQARVREAAKTANLEYGPEVGLLEE